MNNMVKYSNYWEEVHPMLIAKPDINFYVIAGDVGGNADAIAAFHDTWDNTTLLASGMGEVADENYLLVRVHENDSVEFELQPLNTELSLPGIEYFSVPTAVDTLLGPELIASGAPPVEYSVPAVFNAESYLWELPEWATGTSDSSSISVNFAADFREGTISVRASREGFGMGAATTKMIKADNTSSKDFEEGNASLHVEIADDYNCLSIGVEGIEKNMVSIRLIDIQGRVLFGEEIETVDNHVQLVIDKSSIPGGIVILSIITDNQQITRKIAVR